MRELLRPYRAALAQGRRRSIILLLVLASGIFGAVAWSSYRPLEQEREFLRILESPRPLSDDAFTHFAGGFTCSGPEFGPEPGPKETAGVDPQAQSPTGEPEPTPTEEPEPPTQATQLCQLVTNDGRPIGPTFPVDFIEGFKLDPQILQEVRPQLRAEQRLVVERAERAFTWHRILESRIRAASTLLGIVFAVLLGASLMGAEWRWSVWPTMLTHEPRRGRVLGSKFGSLWTFVATGFVFVVAVCSGVDAVMRVIVDIDATGGPSVAQLAEQTGWGLIGLELYATLAAALASIVRTSIAGAAALAVALGDWLLVQKYTWLRHFLPVQQIASLVPHPPQGNVSSGYAWFPQIAGATECTTSPGGIVVECRDIILRPPPHWRASLVLVAWIVGFSMLAWTSLRARDVPL
jgi:hypothetical protein